MKKDCPVCKLVSDPNRDKLYEDDEVVAFAQRVGAVAGQIMVVPKEHYPIIELVPDHVLSQVGKIANKISIAVFDSLGFTGTNVMAANGLPAGQKIAHFGLQVIPRRENDGLNFSWPTKKLNEEEMSTIELKIKEHADHVGPSPSQEVENVTIGNASEENIIEGSDDEENYALKHLERIP